MSVARSGGVFALVLLGVGAVLCPPCDALPPSDGMLPWDLSNWRAAVIERSDQDLDPDRIEWSVLPSVSYNSDDGFFFGALGVVADYDPGYYPYRWRFEGQSSLSVRADDNGDAEFPTHDHYLEVDLPGLFKGVRMRFRLAFQRELRRYRGLGNSPKELPTGAPSSLGQYRISTPSFEWQTRIDATNRFYVTTTLRYQYVWMEVFDGSRLRDDADGVNGEFVQDAIEGIQNHGLITGAVGIEFDSRNHETYPTFGMFHTLQLTGAITDSADTAFGNIGLQSRFYLPLYERWLVLAIRLGLDLSFGEPPVYALPVMGGSKEVRGIPEGYYHGLIRVLGAVEFRSMFWDFTLWGHRFSLGAAAFLDAGRVFADYNERTQLDGTGVDIRFGTGGGVRLMWGESLIFRFDAAWSFDDLGFYAGVGQAF